MSRRICLLVLLPACGGLPASPPDGGDGPSIRQLDAAADAAPDGVEAPRGSCRFRQVATGQHHTCALDDQGLVSCWGWNFSGQLGDGTAKPRGEPRVVARLPRIRRIATGGFHTCAIDEAGGLWCWGENGVGQSGHGIQEDVYAPGPVAGLTEEVVDVAAGPENTCVAAKSGQILCFGGNLWGALGLQDDEINSYRPIAIADVSGTAVAVGTDFACALSGDGAISCWGYGGDGQLGRPAGNQGWTWKAGEVRGLPMAAQAVAAGENHACAVLGDGSAWCWGAGGEGQIGVGKKFVWTQIPAQIALAGVTTIAAGTARTCATLGDGSAWCWGENAEGGVGDGTAEPRLSPARVGAFSGVATGGDHSCGLAADGTLACWGSNASGQLGRAFLQMRPVDVVGAPADPVEIAAGGAHTCARTGGGQIVCWGRNTRGQLGDGTQVHATAPQSVPGLSGARSIAAGDGHTCVATEGGLHCWGGNTYGQIGDGSTTDRFSPVKVAVPGAPVAAVVAGAYHTCTLATDGRVHCWGDDLDGEIGDGASMSQVPRPAPVTLPRAAVSLAAGAYHTCAATADGAAFCWGYNGEGQLGNQTTGNRDEPDEVSLLGDVVEIVAGWDHTCARGNDGVVSCWGANTVGQVGDGAIGRSTFPVPLPLSGTRRLRAGTNATCALDDGGQARCWGDNDYAQLGDGTLEIRPTPVAIDGLVGVIALGLAYHHGCAAGSGWLRCWGAQGYGRLGDGVLGYEVTPVPVEACR